MRKSLNICCHNPVLATVSTDSVPGHVGCHIQISPTIRLLQGQMFAAETHSVMIEQLMFNNAMLTVLQGQPVWTKDTVNLHGMWQMGNGPVLYVWRTTAS